MQPKRHAGISWARRGVAAAMVISAPLTLGACSSESCGGPLGASCDGNDASTTTDAATTDVCKRAEAVVYGCTHDGGTPNEGSSNVTCEGATAKAAQCIVDNPVAACGTGSDDERRKYSACIDAASN